MTDTTGVSYGEIRQCLQSQEIFLGVGNFLIQALSNEFIQLSGEAGWEREGLDHRRNKNKSGLSRGGLSAQPNFHFAD